MRSVRPARLATLGLVVVSSFSSFLGITVGGGLGTRGAAWAAPPPPNAADARREDAKAAFGRGNAAYNLGKYADAIADFEKAYALSRLPDILFNLGQCYRKQWEAEHRSELGRRALHYYEALEREAPQSRFRADADQFVGELVPAVIAAEAK